jgi:hypothetical protein
MLLGLISITLVIMVCGLKRIDGFVIEGVDPTSLTSLVLVIQGLFLSLFMAVYRDNWSWYDMIRGNVYCERYEHLPGHIKKKYTPDNVFKYIMTNMNTLSYAMSGYDACYVNVNLTGKVRMPERTLLKRLKRCGYDVRNHNGRFLLVRGEPGTKFILQAEILTSRGPNAWHTTGRHYEIRYRDTTPVKLRTRVGAEYEQHQYQAANVEAIIIRQSPDELKN